MTSALSFLTSGASAAPPPPSGKPSELADLARTSDVATLTIYARQHPQDRSALESAMIKAGRTGDLNQMSQALKKPDYEVSVWRTFGRAGAGPTYPVRADKDPTYRLDTSGAWDTMQKAGQVTASERNVIGRMAANEGRFDSVQSYDSQVVSVGTMQKTMNPLGTGELPRQVWDFKQANPAKYQSLFADHGWTVERVKPGSTNDSFSMRFTIDGETLTAKETADYIKDRANPEHWGTALGPLQRAGRDPDFQAQQIKDFKTRLDTATAVIPKGANYAKPAGDYLSSEQGAAMLLDQHVNQPAFVDDAIGKALDRFYAANPKASYDPAEWTAKERAAYEPEILAHYRDTRALHYGKSVMTSPYDRADHLTGRSSPLSSDPGSFQATAPR